MIKMIKGLSTGSITIYTLAKKKLKGWCTFDQLRLTWINPWCYKQCIALCDLSNKD